MPRKYLIVLFFLAFVGARHAVPLQGLVFADVPLSQQADPCPPECVTDSMEIVTWYPSPYNEYEELRLYPIKVSNSECNDNNRGLLYYDDEDNKVYVCKGSVGNNDWKALGDEIETISDNIIASGITLGGTKITNWPTLSISGDILSIAGGNSVSLSMSSSVSIVTGSCPSGFTTLMTQWQLGSCDGSRTFVCGPCGGQYKTLSCGGTSCSRGPEWVAGSNNPGWTCAYIRGNATCCVKGNIGLSSCYSINETCSQNTLLKSYCIKN